MACYNTLGPDIISLICPENVHYVHWLRQVLFPMVRLHVWTFFHYQWKPIGTSTEEHLIFMTKQTVNMHRQAHIYSAESLFHGITEEVRVYSFIIQYIKTGLQNLDRIQVISDNFPTYLIHVFLTFICLLPQGKCIVTIPVCIIPDSMQERKKEGVLHLLHMHVVLSPSQANKILSCLIICIDTNEHNGIQREKLTGKWRQKALKIFQCSEMALGGQQEWIEQ